MTDQAIKDAFANMRSGEELQPLQDAARCRSESDWLIGINGTACCYFKRSKSLWPTSFYRWKSPDPPTLSLVIKREDEINNFIPREFFKITSSFELQEGQYTGTFIKNDFKKATQTNMTVQTEYGVKKKQKKSLKLFRILKLLKFLKPKKISSKSRQALRFNHFTKRSQPSSSLSSK